MLDTSTLTWCNIYSRHGYGDHPISNTELQDLNRATRRLPLVCNQLEPSAEVFITMRTSVLDLEANYGSWIQCRWWEFVHPRSNHCSQSWADNQLGEILGLVKVHWGLFVFRLMAERNQTSYEACSWPKMTYTGGPEVRKLPVFEIPEVT